jgi:hypothetical protein
MGFLLHGNRVTVMEKKLTNSGPFIQSTRKHSIYPLLVRPTSLPKRMLSGAHEEIFFSLLQVRAVSTEHLVAMGNVSYRLLEDR